MKLILALLITIPAFGQVTGQICYTPDKTKPARSVCRDVSAEVTKAMRDFVATEGTTTNGVFTPKFAGAAEMIFAHDDGLFASVLLAKPPANVVAAQAQRDTAEALIEARKAAALAKAGKVGADPQ